MLHADDNLSVCVLVVSRPTSSQVRGPSAAATRIIRTVVRGFLRLLPRTTLDTEDSVCSNVILRLANIVVYLSTFEIARDSRFSLVKHYRALAKLSCPRLAFIWVLALRAAQMKHRDASGIV
jgi:hypothetical protein